MSVSPEFKDFALELFHPLGDLKFKNMFGGAGIWCDGIMFVLIADEVLYLKADEALAADLEAEGSEPFNWTRPSDGKVMQMSYWQMPESAMDDPHEALEWGRRARDVAFAANAKKGKKAKKKC